MPKMDRFKLTKILSIVIVSFLLLQAPKQSLAISKPSFPSCLNQTSEPIVYYSTGIHGVPGQSSSYEGEDKVYLLPDGNTLQCLCTVNGDGIHTNWWKTGSLTEEEINLLKADGWILIPDGSLWGLEKTTYMAQNFFYSCKSGETSSTSSSSSSSSSDGEVQGITTTRFGQVLGLATTGNLLAITSYLSFGVLLLLISRLIKR